MKEDSHMASTLCKMLHRLLLIPIQCPPFPGQSLLQNFNRDETHDANTREKSGEIMGFYY